MDFYEQNKENLTNYIKNSNNSNNEQLFFNQQYPLLNDQLKFMLQIINAKTNQFGCNYNNTTNNLTCLFFPKGNQPNTSIFTIGDICQNKCANDIDIKYQNLCNEKVLQINETLNCTITNEKYYLQISNVQQ
eukprot:TRINITY_DN2968_c0_g1_i1.p3 TRINITY_DN2968_c0_g1~~TRINITY_DN2968_c0_g1_i1.p3  ORF type:complete len:132 (-),score=0.52 TRINITY_DN2968_c0_g1_i1:21-416(-)